MTNLWAPGTALSEVWSPLPGYPGYDGTLTGAVRRWQTPKSRAREPRVLKLIGGRYYALRDASGTRWFLRPERIRDLMVGGATVRGEKGGAPC